MDNRVVKCGDCDLILDEPSGIVFDKREPCPECGSLNRKTEIQLACGVSVFAGLAVKLRDYNNKIVIKLKTFREFYRKLSIWQNTSYIVNRRDNKYDKTVTDPNTGKVLYERHEPLSKHTGHGSAKKSKKEGG